MQTAAHALDAPECRCIEQMNDLLKPHGGELLCNLFGPPRAIVSTWQHEAPKGKRRKKAPLVFASFCPFCGVKYARPEEAAPVDAAEEQGLPGVIRPPPGRGEIE